MRLGRNLFAGLVNSALVALVGLAATPGYLHLLGLERYGIIGLFVSVQALLSLLDMGLSPTLNREVARASASGAWANVHGLLASLGRLYWAVAVGVGIVAMASASWLANRWLRPDALGVDELASALAWMGLAVASRWPAGLYASAINGAQRLAVSSSLASAYALVSAGGALALMAWMEASLVLFFGWQAACALAYSLAVRSVAWRIVGGAGAKPEWSELQRVWRFSASMGLIAVTSVVFTQLDKVLLSRMLDLEAFGRYALANLVAGGLYVVVTPVFGALYPRFSALVAGGRDDELWSLYRLGTRMMATLVFPLVVVVVVLAQPLVGLWTGKPALAAAVAPVVALLCAGTALHAVMYLPYALQLANGVPRLSVGINLVMIALLVPLTISLTLLHGEVGAAAAWLALHLFYLALGTTVTHRHFFRGRGLPWLARDVGLPLLFSIGIGVLAWAAGLQAVDGALALVSAAAATWFATTVACLAISPGLRDVLKPHLASFVGRGRRG